MTNSLGYGTIDNFIRILFDKGIYFNKNTSKKDIQGGGGNELKETEQFQILSEQLGMNRDQKLRLKQSIIYAKDLIKQEVIEKKIYSKEGPDNEQKIKEREILKEQKIDGDDVKSGIDMKLDKKPGAAGFTTFKHCYEAGVNFKATGDCLIIAPMFISEKKHIDEIVEKLRTGINNYAKSKKN